MTQATAPRHGETRHRVEATDDGRGWYTTEEVFMSMDKHGRPVNEWFPLYKVPSAGPGGETYGTPELAYRMYRGIGKSAKDIPDWNDLEPWIRDAIAWCCATAWSMRPLGLPLPSPPEVKK